MTSFDILNDILMKSKFEIDVERDDEVKPDMWLKVNPFNLKPVQVADIRPYTHEEKEETPLVEFKLPELHGKLKEAIDEHYASLNARRYRQDPDIMDAAIYGKFAIDKVKENEMERGCSNCKYHSLRVEFMPCSACSNHSHWKPKEDEMDNRVKKIQNELMKFAEEKRLGYEFEYDSFTNRLKAKFTEGPFCKKYEIHGDGCNPNVMIADITRDLTQFFKLKSSTMYGDLPSIKNVIFNDPATIVFWTDGTKTVVKAQDEAYDPEKGMAMAIAKKALGNQGNYCNVFKKWLPEEVEIEFNGFDMVSFNEAVEAVKKMSEKLKAMKDKELEEAEEKVKELTFTDAMAAISEFAKHFNLGEVDFRLVPKEEENEITDKSI